MPRSSRTATMSLPASRVRRHQASVAYHCLRAPGHPGGSLGSRSLARRRTHSHTNSSWWPETHVEGPVEILHLPSCNGCEYPHCQRKAWLLPPWSMDKTMTALTSVHVGTRSNECLCGLYNPL